MTAVVEGRRVSAASSGLLGKERIAAGPGFNRWIVPPAALSILRRIDRPCGFPVFWLLLSKALGIQGARPDDIRCR